MKLFLTILALAGMTMGGELETEQLLNAGNRIFTSRMFSEVVKANPDKSVVISAFSVLTPLAQLGLASVGESHDELLKAIGLPNDNATKDVFTLVNQKLRSVKGVDLRMASRVYIPEGFELNDQFAALSRDVFGSEVKNVDFTKSVETAGAINAWVEDQTNHRIKDLVNADSLTPSTRAVLVNAIYFKGTWQDKFNAAMTSDRDFHVTKEKTIKIPMMHRKGNYKYTDSAELNSQILELPYVGGESSMLIILPKDGIAALEEKLKDPALLTKATENMYEYEVDVYLPKFKIETKTNLKEVLENMNVKRLFDSKEARLDNLLKKTSDLFVSEAFQKAFIEVNEEGAEATAANAFYVVDRAYFSRTLSFEFVADRPFYFELRYHNYRLKMPLFAGVISQPA